MGGERDVEMELIILTYRCAAIGEGRAYINIYKYLLGK